MSELHNFRSFLPFQDSKALVITPRLARCATYAQLWKEPSFSSNFLNPFLLSFFLVSLMIYLLIFSLSSSNPCFCFSNVSVLLSPTSAILYQLFFFNLVSAFQPFINSLSSYLSIFLGAHLFSFSSDFSSLFLASSSFASAPYLPFSTLQA